jgi:hypothetical protein
MYWTLKSIPELAGLSGRERRYLWNLVASRTLIGNGRVWIYFLIGPLLSAVGGGAVRLLQQSEAIGQGWWLVAIGSTIGGMIGFSMFFQAWTAAARPHLRAEREKMVPGITVHT